MSIRHLRTLVTVFEKGSFAAAADTLCLTQSAVSQQIRALEEELGVELFDRTLRSPQINTDGREAYERSCTILQQYDALSEGLGPINEQRGNLSVGAIHTVQILSMAPVLAHLREHYPHVFIRIFSGMSSDLVNRVEEGILDAVVVTGPPQQLARGCEWHLLKTEQFYLIVPAEYPEMSATEILQNSPFIRFDRRAWAGTMIDDELRTQGLQPNVTMELDSLQAAQSMVEHGMGVTIMPLSQAMIRQLSPRLRLIPFGQVPLTREIGLYQRKSHNRLHLTGLFLEGMQVFYNT